MPKLVKFLQKDVQSFVQFITSRIVNKKHVQTLRICPKYVHNMSKLWTHYGHMANHSNVAELECAVQETAILYLDKPRNW